MGARRLVTLKRSVGSAPTLPIHTPWIPALGSPTTAPDTRRTVTPSCENQPVTTGNDAERTCPPVQ